MNLSRRDAFKGLLTGGAIVGGHAPFFLARADSQTLSSQISSWSLDNGLRVHVVANDSRYICASLVLRSSLINAEDGIAHLMEHTSFVGAAGAFSASEVKGMHKDWIQESNAITEPGMIQWQASFLPKYFEQVLGLLAVTTLDQKFDVETVAREARVVLQELYLDHHHAGSRRRRILDTALFGSNHPYGIDTIKSEIAKAKIPPERLAAELRGYAPMIRLPANIDLFLVGGFDASVARTVVGKCFGPFPFAQGPMLAVPRAPVTRAYSAFTAASAELRRPLSEIKIAWNTGVGIAHPEVKAVLVLSEYLNEVLFGQLRERHGDTYNPEASYEPDRCSGIFKITIPSTEAPHTIEHKVFQGIAELKAGIDARELGRFRDRVELKRRKNAESNDTLVEGLVDSVVQGGSIYDLDLETVTRDDIIAAARTYLPSHGGAYVRLSLLGR
jgi:predicted Zn-dependent peptidase